MNRNPIMLKLFIIVLLLCSLAAADAQTQPAVSEPLPTTRTPGNLYDFGNEQLTVERVVGTVAVIKVDGTKDKFLLQPDKRPKAGRPYRFDVRYFEFVEAVSDFPGESQTLGRYKPLSKKTLKTRFPKLLHLKDDNKRTQIIDVASKGEDVIRFKDVVSLAEYDKKVSDLNSVEKRFVRKWEPPTVEEPRPVAIGDSVFDTKIENIWLGKVVGISDGDTATVLNSKNEQVKIRFLGIDTPESKQAFGSKAKEALGKLIFQKQVRVLDAGKDRYGRTLGFIELPINGFTVAPININAEMVRQGFAWHYKDFNSSPELGKLEADAKAAKRGLWADPEPMPPWEWRKQQK